ncbi:hypothetical protein [Jhaorihella thermophila]|uniref:Uncharacterized protein n=1 Tax=Jhaorihella thermophila TaxID=488547 RepID=A0A1H5YMZ3_9RHOB|nr:hypothetical protein [Jhaorihella thermophila]SEG24945.1 hypothetical protein SAMN05421751_12026 [Jhaorihella thermophila]
MKPDRRTLNRIALVALAAVFALAPVGISLTPSGWPTLAPAAAWADETAATMAVETAAAMTVGATMAAAVTAKAGLLATTIHGTRGRMPTPTPTMPIRIRRD